MNPLRNFQTYRAAIVLAASLLAAPAGATESLPAQAAALLREYIAIDTSNPPGNETAAAKFLQRKFADAGIEAKVFEAAPGRGSVLARLPGSGKRKPIVLLNHLDVVPVQAKDWQYPPFAAEEHDGYIYGRGAIDCKGPGVVDAMALIELKRAGVVLDRDVFFLGTADEEVGGKYGAGWFADQHLAELGDAEFVLNEGGFINVEQGRRIFEVSALEKAPCWLKLTAEGKSGHGSTPPAQTAPKRLIAALAKLTAYEPPIRVLPEVAAYYAALARFEEGPRAKALADLPTALKDDAFRAEFLTDPVASALVRNTIAPTVLTGSNKTNVIPAQASAEVDVRLLPGETCEAFVNTVRQTIGDESVKVEVLLNFPPSASPTDTALFEAIRKVGEAEGAVVVPKMLRGFTDSHFFRAKGIVSYGFVPLEVPPEDDRRMHGIDERVSVKALGDAVTRLMAILQAM